MQDPGYELRRIFLPRISVNKVPWGSLQILGVAASVPRWASPFGRTAGDPSTTVLIGFLSVTPSLPVNP